MDIKGFFDNIDHSLLLKALRCHTRERWILLYVERWLQAEVEMPDGKREARDKGTPQGGVVTLTWRQSCARVWRLLAETNEIVEL